MNGFYRAQIEYERHLECPYDVSGALYEEDEEEYHDKQDDIGNMEYDRIKEDW